jgi:hypothetical protein
MRVLCELAIELAIELATEQGDLGHLGRIQEANYSCILIQHSLWHSA